MEREEFQKALDSAGRMLSHQPLTRQRLCRKLVEKGYDPETADQVVQMLTERGYLDDLAYACRVVDVFKRKGYGILRIRQELFQRGVDRETVQEALTDFETEDQVLDQLLGKKLKGQRDPKAIQKAAAALCRKGYTWEEIRGAIRRYGNKEDYE